MKSGSSDLFEAKPGGERFRYPDLKLQNTVTQDFTGGKSVEIFIKKANLNPSQDEEMYLLLKHLF